MGSGGSRFKGADGASGWNGMGAARRLTHAALIAAVYAALTLWLAPLSFAQQQLRVAEALSVLPAFTPAAAPGLFVGCIIANIFSPLGLPDMICGSLATLVSALLARAIALRLNGRGAVWLRAVLVPLPAVLVNTVVIGAMICIMTGVAFPAAALGVLSGQALSCYGLGVPLYFAFRVFTRH